MTIWFRLAAAAALVIGAALPLAAEPVFPPGSRIGLEPPRDMTLSRRFSGFENPAKAAAITFVEMPEQAYAELATGLTPEALAQQGMTIRSREPIQIGGRDAILIVGDQAAAGIPLRKWMLVASEPTLTALVIAQSVAGEQGYTDEAIRGALATLVLRPALSVEQQLAALPFKIGNLAGFRPVRVVAGNSLYLTDGPKDQIREAEQPVVILAGSIGGAPPQADRAVFARQAFFSGPGLTDLAVERSQSFRQGGAEWHEIVARGKDPSGQEVVVSQAIRFSSEGYVRMVGIARLTEREAFLPRFRTLVDSIDVQ